MSKKSQNPIKIDPFVSPADLLKYLRIGRETLRTSMRDGKVPPFDIFLSQKVKGWHHSTLARAGLLPLAQTSSQSDQS
jgi:hypothetical protein